MHPGDGGEKGKTTLPTSHLFSAPITLSHVRVESTLFQSQVFQFFPSVATIFIGSARRAPDECDDRLTTVTRYHLDRHRTPQGACACQISLASTRSDRAPQCTTRSEPRESFASARRWRLSGIFREDGRPRRPVSTSDREGVDRAPECDAVWSTLCPSPRRRTSCREHTTHTHAVRDGEAAAPKGSSGGLHQAVLRPIALGVRPQHPP